MSITAAELAEKRSLIQTGMEFLVPSRHVKSGQYLVRVTNVSTLNKRSCWGEYEAETVWYDIVCQKTKQTVFTNHLPDGSTQSYLDDVIVPGEFIIQQESMSLASFIEYKYNKRKVLEV